MVVKGHDKKVKRNIKYKNMKSKKGPFKMKKSPAKHTGMGAIVGGAVGNLGMSSLASRPISAGENIPQAGMPIGGLAMGAPGFLKGIKPMTGKRSGRKRRNMGALNMFKNRIKGIFG